MVWSRRDASCSKALDCPLASKNEARRAIRLRLGGLGIANATNLPDMRLSEISDKSRAVLKALAKGRSCEQLLAADRTLTAHDIFRALSESPTGFWDKRSTPKTSGEHADA